MELANIKLNAPFIMKSSFYQSNKSNNQKNVAHISYIANRPGVELETIDLREDVDKPVAEIVKEIKPGTSLGHIKYMGERPNSHGLFGSAGQENIKEIQKELKDHKGIVWRKILSLREDDANRLGFNNREAWETALKKSVPLAAESMGIRESNLRWVAAYHHEKGHPHVHLVLWEKEPWRRKGILSNGELSDMKKVFVREVYEEERVQLMQERTAMRDCIRILADKKINDVIEGIQKETKSFEQLKHKPVVFPEPIYDKDVSYLNKELQNLAEIMPKKGRVSFGYMPESVKEKVIEISKELIKLPQFSPYVRKYVNNTEDLSRIYSHDESQTQHSVKRAMDDLEKRVSQVILKGASHLNSNSLPQSFDRFEQLAVKQTEHITLSVWKGLHQGIQQTIHEQEVSREQLLRRLSREAKINERINRMKER